jgi:hypothetical protein
MFKLSFFLNYNNDDFFSALTILKDNLPRQENGSDFLGIEMDLRNAYRKSTTDIST